MTASIIDWIMLILGGVFFLIFLVAAVISFAEKEFRAVTILLVLALIIPAPFIVLSSVQSGFADIMGWILLVFIAIVSAILLLPGRKVRLHKRQIPSVRIDERNIMFSRKLLIPGTERYGEYYLDNPELEQLDNKFRKRPGLLKKGSTFYDPVIFPATDASFDTIKALHVLAEGKPLPEKVGISAEQATRFVKNWAKKLGAKNVGITQLRDYHKYTVVGRGADYGKPVNLNHPTAIALTVEMQKDLIDTAPSAPVVLETSHQYLESGEVAIQIAILIRRLGFNARAHIDGNYRVVCPLVARDAGLGEIGRMGLLMTPREGPRVRISVVTTDIPLLYDQVKPDATVEDFCLVCKKCAVNCPSSAIPFDEPKIMDGAVRWQINQEQCYTYWSQAGTDCGKCIAVCPYSHEDNILHNFVRYGIRQNGRFRKIAALMDDLFYGKKPPSKPIPKRIRWKN